jgi:hypothetical protein
MTKTARCDHPPIFSVEQVASGSRVMVKELALEANDTKNDRGTIRATLSFWRGETLVYRDRVALTSAKSRGNVLRALRKITKCRVPDAALLALDEAVRRGWKTSANSALDPPSEPSLRSRGSLAQITGATSDEGLQLLPQHAELITASGISPEVAKARGYRSVTVKAELRRLGFSEPQRLVPALLIPVYGVTGEIMTYQIRPDQPRVRNGRPVKYETPRSSRMVLDVHPSIRSKLGDPGIPLLLTEGIRKGDSATSHGLCCVALLGVWNWRGTNEHGGKVALADWEAIALNGRDAYIVFDSDVMIKPEVHAALRRLKALLESRGARVMQTPLPSGEGGVKVGLDDFLAAGHSVTELLALARFDSPTPPQPESPSAENPRASDRMDIEKLTKAAAPVLAAPDPLPLVEQAFRDMGYGGDLRPPCIVYLAATSRLLRMRRGSMPVHLLLLGVASTGKSFTLQVALQLMPQEAYHAIDAGSPRVLIYDTAGLRHRVAIFAEADSLPAGEDNPAASAIRNLLQEHRLQYQVVVRDPETGDFVVQKIVKDGPTVLITSAVRRLGPQLDTRLFSLEVPDDIAQVREALNAQADVELNGCADPDPSLIAYQAYLQALAPWDVAVPFVKELTRAIAMSVAVPRIQRDFSRLLSLIKTVAVLRHQHRQRDNTGRLIATLDDYRIIYELVGDMYEATATGASRQVRAVVEAVTLLKSGLGDAITVTRVANHLEINKMAASRRIKTAVANGWLVNGESRRGYPADLDFGEPMPAATGLPHPDALCNGVTPLTAGDVLDPVAPMVEGVI